MMRAWGFGFRACGLGSRIQVWGLMLRIRGSKFRRSRARVEGFSSQGSWAVGKPE